MEVKKPWVVQYMYETDRKKRKVILDRAIEEEGMSPENELRSKLFEARYGIVESRDVDYFIRGWMSLFYMNGSAKGIFGKRKVSKQKEEILADWKVAMCEEYGEIGKTVLYEELFNMAYLYITLCTTDKNYGAILLGLGHMKDEDLVNKIAKDVYTMAYETPESTDTVEDFAIFTQAATDAFCAKFDDEKDLLLKRIPERAKNAVES